MTGGRGRSRHDQKDVDVLRVVDIAGGVDRSNAVRAAGRLSGQVDQGRVGSATEGRENYSKTLELISQLRARAHGAALIEVVARQAGGWIVEGDGTGVQRGHGSQKKTDNCIPTF